jgi:hypothetical protein
MLIVAVSKPLLLSCNHQHRCKTQQLNVRQDTRLTSLSVTATGTRNSSCFISTSSLSFCVDNGSNSVSDSDSSLTVEVILHAEKCSIITIKLFQNYIHKIFSFTHTYREDVEHIPNMHFRR